MREVLGTPKLVYTCDCCGEKTEDTTKIISIDVNFFANKYPLYNRRELLDFCISCWKNRSEDIMAVLKDGVKVD
jgi:hypothetical protein